MKMIKLFFILLLHAITLSVMAQAKADKQYKYGKDYYNKAVNLFRNGKITEGNEAKSMAKSKLNYAKKLATEKNLKIQIQDLIDKCNKLSTNSVVAPTSVTSANKWSISWDEEQQCIQLKSGNQTVFYKMISVEGGTYGEAQTTIMSFSIGETEVTELLWNVVMKGGVSTMNLNPKTNVSWTECNKFIEKLEEKTGIIFRLPDANEWEYAASGGNKSKGYDYAGSNDLNEITCLDYLLKQVKQYKGNELEIYDMTGNASEWTSTPDENFGGYVLKGGSYVNANKKVHINKKKLKITTSEHLPETDKKGDLGFRIVKSYE